VLHHCFIQLWGRFCRQAFGIPWLQRNYELDGFLGVDLDVCLHAGQLDISARNDCHLWTSRLHNNGDCHQRTDRLHDDRHCQWLIIFYHGDFPDLVCSASHGDLDIYA
ncbi:hypothetical protein LTR94_004908, partial [Friedmanniomyces endolithicus]